ncbi:MAG: hypothetical protein DI626_11255 [Micavibrio aeruginosavorus]|uniref:Basal-body rod modification protein FlgD n=1 Tax=Micavibrio aeruginosavorus TaxID=349221 RepID=A0A2W4ZDR9_9BACT|nr:MAG: hypothetical protein DI626_11255 [Micavibrio aeruginosavorus]
MATTNPVTTSGVANNAAKTGQSTVKLAEDFQQFLTLLTTQLQNQDPLSPMDSTEFTNQLVQFSQVEQQINMNQKMDNLVSLQLASISSVALGYVGMDISYVSAEMNYEGKPIDINYALSEEAVTAKVNVYDQNDNLVYSADVPKNAGTNQVTWNGTKTNGEALPAGTYSVKIDAVNKAGTAIENSTVVTGRVRGIETQNGIVYVLVGERAIALSSIVNANATTSNTGSASAALGYVGMDVSYETSDLKFDGTNPIEINYSLEEKAANSAINIYDKNGVLVYTAPASQMPGTNKFTWNGASTKGGTAGAGDYTVKVEATTSENKNVNTTTFFYGRVDGVENKGGIAYVTIGDKSVPASSILNAKKPTTTV